MGTPLLGTEIHLLEQVEDINDFSILRHIISTEEVGEIYISGPCLAAGYWYNDELTKRCFVHIKHPQTGEVVRAYRTGDLARRSEHHSNEFIYTGRIDNQFKLRGQRIEPGHIENHLKEFCYQGKRIVESAYVVKVEVMDNAHLVAYLITDKIPACSVTEVHSYIKSRLPGFMAPNAIRWLTRDDVKLNKNDKV